MAQPTSKKMVQVANSKYKDYAIYDLICHIHHNIVHKAEADLDSIKGGALGAKVE